MNDEETPRLDDRGAQELSADQGSSSLELYDEPVADVDTIPFEGSTIRVVWHLVDGYRFGSANVEYSGPWFCLEKHTWDGAAHGPTCPTCGRDGNPNRPPPPPLPAPAPPDEVCKRLRGLVRYLRESPKQEPADRLRWVARKVAWMLLIDELVDIRSAVRALRADAEAAGIPRALAQTIIQTECESTWRRRRP